MLPVIDLPKIDAGRFNFGGAIDFSSPVSWEPNPGPQTQAYHSQADVLGYGGAAGGGKSALLLGLAATAHTRSAIFRRVFPNLRGLIEESRAIMNPEGDTRNNDSYNESLHRWVLDGGKRMIEFEACQFDKHKEKQRGRPRDFYGFDEATEFSRGMIDFITAWNRTTIKGQRCRVVLTFNPPTDDSGSWVIDYFLPWLAYLHPEKFDHPNPARPGELRWYATVNGEEVECENGDSFEVDGEWIEPRSRTFIPARLEDNPYLADGSYRSRLQSLPEPLRSQLLYGDFAADAMADPWQAIPTEWVRAAQRRWLERERPNIPLSGVGVDVARGGKDKLVISKRFGWWFDEIKAVPGVDVEDGPAAAGMVSQAIENERHIGYINVDVIGVGSSAYDSLKAMYPGQARAVNAANRSDYESRAEHDGKPIFKMKNVRAAYYWMMREALAPENGIELALPPDKDVLPDLCGAKYKVLAGGVIQIEEKEKIKERLGRSPDVGEAIMMALYEAPPETIPGAFVGLGAKNSWYVKK